MWCRKKRSSTQSSKTQNVLKPFGKWHLPPTNFIGCLITKYDYYDYQEWRKVNLDKIKIAQLEKELEVMRNQLLNVQIQQTQIPSK